MKRTKHMLIGLMLCGAVALAGGVATLNAYDGETVSVSAEESAFTETATTVSINSAYENGRIGFLLGTSDYSTANQVVSLAQLETLNTLTSITYNDKTLGESYYKVDDPNIYLQMWTKPNTMYFPVAQPVAGDVIKIAAGTQFPSSAYLSDGTMTCYVIPNAIAYKYDGSAWVADYSSVEFTEIETDVTIHRWADNRLMLKVAGGDHANASGNNSISAGTFKALGTFDGILINGKAISDMTLNECFMKLYGEGDIAIGALTFNARDVVTIKAGTKFPSYAFFSEGTTTCYTTKEDMSWMFMPTDVTDRTFNWVRCDFEETDTVVTSIEYENNRLGFYLSENDYANAANNSFTFAEDKIFALNALVNITVNGTTLADLWSGDVAFMQMWERKALWVPVSAFDEGAVLLIPAGTQFPTYAYANDGTLTCYTTTEEVKYVLSDGAWKKALNVTINGETQEMLAGDKIAKPETPADYEEDGYKYTAVWYVAGTDTVYDFDAPLTEDVAIESKYSQEAIEYTYMLVIDPTDRVNGAQMITAKYGEALTVADPEAEGKEFLGWVDGQGNTVTIPETMPIDGGVAYASWKINAYSLTIVNGDSQKTIKFGVVADPDNGVEAGIDNLAFILEGELPADDDAYTYAWAEEVPETFELKDYTFTVVATEKIAKVTIVEALEKEDGKKVEVSGTVCTINTAWSESYGNISVTITDGEGNELYLYRMNTNVALGDIITVTGEMATYNGNRQIAAGATAEITDHDSSYDYVEMTIEEALAAADGVNVIVTGTVVEIQTAYSEQYKNISVYIADDNGTRIYLYRLSGNVEVGQIIKVKGATATYNEARQITGGTYEEVGTHECSKYTEATCQAPAECVVCGEAKDDVLGAHDYVDGICTVCGEAEAVPPTSEEPEPPVSEEPEDPATSEKPEDPATSEEGEKKKGGCGSSLGLGMAGALTAVGAALVLKKRKED